MEDLVVLAVLIGVQLALGADRAEEIGLLRGDILLLELADLQGASDLRSIASERAATSSRPAQPEVIVEAEAAGGKVSVVP